MSRASCRATPNSGKALAGLIFCVGMRHRARFSGVLGSVLAIGLQPAMPLSGGPAKTAGLVAGLP